MSLLRVERLSVDLAVPAGTLHAVRDVSFDLDKGRTLCLVGESGCGKSMTALALMGLLPKAATRTAARLAFDGVDLQGNTHEGLRGKRIAMIFQEPMTALNPAYTIGNQMVEVHRRHLRSSNAAARERAVFLLEKVGIGSAAQRLGQYPHQLSGGLRQRVMIAMALMCAPDLVVADEPTTALDVTIQAQILLLLKDLQREFGMALLLITHDLGVVARVADDVAVMYAGAIVERASTASLFAAPKHPYTQGLLACMPVPGRTPPGGRLGAIEGSVPALTGTIAGCAFAPRCGEARDACAAPPPWNRAADGHGWACIR
jgi:peptide/nickel transport system ATP-binding protein